MPRTAGAGKNTSPPGDHTSNYPSGLRKKHVNENGPELSVSSPSTSAVCEVIARAAGLPVK